MSVVMHQNPLMNFINGLTVYNKYLYLKGGNYG